MAVYLDRLTADMKTAMKAGDKPRLEVVRMLISEIKKRAEAEADDLSDDDEGSILQKAVKTRVETVGQAKAAGRNEIAEKEQAEIELIQAYLPQQMSAAEVTSKVKAVAAEVGYASAKDTGKFMKAWMSQYKGLADGKLVKAALDDVL